MRLTIERAFEKYEASMLRRGFSVNTIKNKKLLYQYFAFWLSKNHPEAFQDFKAVSCEIIEGFFDFVVSNGVKLSTRKNYVSNIKAFFSFLYKNDFIASDPTRRLENIRVPRMEVVYIPHNEIMQVLDTDIFELRKFHRYDLAERNYFIVRVAYVTGWRASESLACNPGEDIDWETGAIHIPKGKGGKDGYVYMDMDTCKGLKKWYYSNYPNGKRLWYSQDRKELSYNGYLRVVKKYFGKGTHRLRASFATHLFSRDVDIKNIQELMRHESITSTVRYIGTDKTKIKSIHNQKNPFSN
ncbi:MAG: tyrosine-type recombinase/integrase [Candidatus Margulisbacteria bacterium]|nr:tyrosine-type recombinase/integrase [Candidatus Margulisiibacteriota bacterium]